MQVMRQDCEPPGTARWVRPTEGRQRPRLPRGLGSKVSRPYQEASVLRGSLLLSLVEGKAGHLLTLQICILLLGRERPVFS